MTETPIHRSAGTADRVLTVLFFGIYLLIGLFLAWYLLLVHNLTSDNCRFTAPGCGPASTVVDLINSVGMGLVLVVAVVVTITRLRRLRRAWWVPVAALILTGALFVVADLIIDLTIR